MAITASYSAPRRGLPVPPIPGHEMSQGFGGESLGGCGSPERPGMVRWARGSAGAEPLTCSPSAFQAQLFDAINATFIIIIIIYLI